MLEGAYRLAYAILAAVRYNSTYLATGDVTGYVISIYTDVMGDLFLGVVMLAVFGGLYIRTQDIVLPAIVWILIGTALEVAIPTGGMSLGKGLVIIAIGGLFYRLFMGMRN